MKWTPIVAIICIAGLLAFAVAKGIDGALLARPSWLGGKVKKVSNA